jgi:hypothetical protein
MSSKLGIYEDERRYDVVIEEILDLKLRSVKDRGTKLKIQKLQQELESIEARLNI